MTLPLKLAFLSAFGAMGTLLRYGVYALSQRCFGDGYPIATVVVNLTGSFSFGLVWAATERWTPIGPEVRLLVLTGFMGAFTTFSTFASDATRLFAEGRWGTAIGDILLQNFGGVAAVFLGWTLVRMAMS